MKRSAGMRFFIVGVLVLLMTIPMFFVGAVVNDRSYLAREAAREVGREWGGPQILSGPVLIVPVQGPVTRTEEVERKGPDGKIVTEVVEITEVVRKSAVRIYPEQFDVAISAQTEERRRGLFPVPVFRSELTAGLRFPALDLTGVLSKGEQPLWDAARLEIRLSDNRALRGEASLVAQAGPLRLEPLTGQSGPGGLVARTGDPRQLGDLTLKLGINGAEQLMVAPVGRNTQVTMASDWPDPSFGGAFLPNDRTVSDTGFEASWTIPHLARNLAQMSRYDSDSAARDLAFGVQFYQPNDFYQKAYRAARYAILFIALTFLTVMLIENRTGKPTHPVQYVLIGLAQSVFVLLMVAYAEQFGFGPAYAGASAATIALLMMFGWTGLKLGRRTWVLGALLVLLYAVLYLILRSADYALLAGATLAFVALGATMFATKDEDWYGPETASGGGWFRRTPKVPAGQVPPPKA